MSDPILSVQLPAGRGRAYKHPVTGELYPSVTNSIGVLDKPALPRWAAKEVAAAAWDRRKVLVTIDDRDEAVDMLKGLPWRTRNKAANVGTVVHEIAEALSLDAPLPRYDEEHEPFVDSFLQFCSDFSPTFITVEGTVFSDEHHYAGTFDAVAKIGTFTVMLDHKTGSGVYPEVALQLAALRYGDSLWDPETGDLGPMPKVDGCIAVHLRPGKAAVHVIEADERAFRAFLGLRQAWDWTTTNQAAVGPRMNRARLLREFSPAAEATTGSDEDTHQPPASSPQSDRGQTESGRVGSSDPAGEQDPFPGPVGESETLGV